MRKYFLLLLIFTSFFCPSKILAQSISNINIGPTNLDISRFSPYYFTAEISSYPTDAEVFIDVEAINGDVGTTCWDFYTDGTCASEKLTFNMTYDSANTWKKTQIYPDYIYPEIFFATPEITWNNSPSEINIWRRNYHLLKMQNPFTMTPNMSFWIEFNALANNPSNSSNLQVYVVSKDVDLNYFESDWRNKDKTELVATFDRNTVFHHQHNPNSSHHLVALSTDSNGKIGSKALDLSNEFWIILYQDSVNLNRGWNLRYHDSSICTNNNSWYIADRSGGGTWNNPIYQNGCPDVHIHLARREYGESTIKDGVKVTVRTSENQGEVVSLSQEFYYNELPNLAPNSTNFVTPVIGSVYDGDTLNISWQAASDPNSDPLLYAIYLWDIESNTAIGDSLASGIGTTSFNWDITGVENGEYSLKGVAYEDKETNSLSTDFFLNGNFTINKGTEILSLNPITISSSNSNPSLAVSGDIVSLSFLSTGNSISPQVEFQSGGDVVNGEISVIQLGIGDSFIASYIVNSDDTDGTVSFTITATNLDQIYFETTNDSYVEILNPTPVPTPTPTPTPINNNSLSRSSPSFTFSCTNSKPLFKSDLFEIRTTLNTAKLFFTPQADTSDYFVSFSEKPNAEEHGELVSLLSEGVQSEIIYLLKPNTIYYVKVRGQNGCIPGDWSNIMQFKTDSKTYYKNFSPKISSKTITTSKLTKNNESIESTPTPIIQNNQDTNPQPIKTPEVKKKCFLWWCW